MDYLHNLPLWVYFFLAIGAASIAAVGGVLLSTFSSWVKEQIEHLIYIHRYKHRFDKPPLAECYCKDCEEWHPQENCTDEGSCWGLAGRVTADCWFCWQAKPKFKE